MSAWWALVLHACPPHGTTTELATQPDISSLLLCMRGCEAENRTGAGAPAPAAAADDDDYYSQMEDYYASVPGAGNDNGAGARSGGRLGAGATTILAVTSLALGWAMCVRR